MVAAAIGTAAPTLASPVWGTGLAVVFTVVVGVGVLGCAGGVTGGVAGGV